ncbi:DMT family transporter [Roseovarius sp. SCSIO 43702]|uniref:DMT family transporter n=1 Tax=Roseovarius sp. SCSIO 43702 TaxID=2823043 RepID=UPI001C735F56|nr:DMT family transporter [Roseovarius sp. SCSIO 43702]QYX58425.1 DMT family transporter [Roseovarius sp. SCSIO 43702]
MSTHTVLIASALMIVTGVAVAVQSPINAAMGRIIESSLAAATVSFFVGFVALLILTLAVGDGPSLPRVTSVPPWLLVGGLFGALFVWSSLWSVSILGLLTLTIMVVLGQVAAAMVIDYLGAFGLTARPISIPRILAACCLLAGVVLSRY